MTIKYFVESSKVLEFCCDKLEQIWVSRLLDRANPELPWYIKTEEEYDYLYIKYCPFCGEKIYE